MLFLKKTKSIHHRGTEGTEFYIVNTPQAQLTITKLPLCTLCLCGKKVFDLFAVNGLATTTFNDRQVAIDARVLVVS